ncbi:MAG: hypothetical protein AB1Z55_09310, partial [Acidimicrobiia bacterium]
MSAAARVLLVVLALSMLALPGAAQVTDEDIARAEAELAALQVELSVLTDEWEAAVARRVLLQDAVEAQSQALLETTLSVEDLSRSAEERAAEMYMDAAMTGLSTLFAPGSIDGAGAGLGYLDEVAGADRQLIAELEAQSIELDRQQDELGVARADLDDAVDDLDANVALIVEKLDAAQQKINQLKEQQAREEEERRRRAAEAAARRAAVEAAAAAAAAPAASSTTQPATWGGSSGSSGGESTPTTAAPPTTEA